MWSLSREKSNVADEVAMREVMDLLDDWHAPEPSPWFDARTMAQFRAEQQKPAEGWLSRLRDRWLFDSGSLLKPAMVGALAVVMVAGGGGYWQVHSHQVKQPTMSAAVQDLQVLDNNAQTIQEMGQLLGDSDDGTPQS